MADIIDPKYKQPNAPAQPKKPQGTGFTNIQRIIGANQGNRLGSAIQGGVSNVAQQARTNLQQATGKFQQDVDANRLGTDQQKQYVTDTIKDTTKAVGDTPEAKQIRENFLKYRTGSYTGPQQLQDAASLRAQAADAGQLGQSATTASGRQNLLQRFVGAPAYTGGQQRVDSLLLGQQGQGALKGIRRETAGLEGEAIKGAETAASQGQGAVAQARGFADETLGKLGTAQTETIGTEADPNTIKGRLALAQKAETARKQDYDDMNRYLRGEIRVGELPGSENLSEADRNVVIGNSGIGLIRALDLASRRGYISPEEFNDITLAAANAPAGFDINNIIKNTLTERMSENVNDAGVATPEQLARVNSLAMLAGKENVYDPLSGRYKAGGMSLNAKNIRQAVEDELKRRNSQFKTDFGKQDPSTIDNIKKFLSAEAAGASFRSNINDIDPFGSPMDTAKTAANLTKQVYEVPTQVAGDAVVGSGEKMVGGVEKIQDGDYLGGAVDTSFGIPLATLDTAARTGAEISSSAGAVDNQIGDVQSSVDNKLGLDTLDARLGGLGLLSTSGAFNTPTRAISGSLSEGGGQFFSGLGQGMSGLAAGNLGSSLSGFGQAVVSPFVAAREAAKRIPVVGGIFCFAANTPVLMADGKYKYIQDLDLYNETAQGGIITVSGKAISEEMYDYRGTQVTGGHAVFEEGKWVRVKDSKHGKNLNITEPVTIYTVSNMEHVLLINDTIFADYSETDLGATISDTERLTMLNSNIEKNVNLVKIEKGLKEHYAYIKILQSEGALQDPSRVVGSI